MSIDCPICYLPQSQWHGSTKAKCGHDVCMPCLLTWAAQNPTCPMCRNRLTNAVVAVEDEYNPDAGWGFMMPAIAERSRHEELRYQSSLRRIEFLEQTRSRFETHCETCTDSTCITTHNRQRIWLTKGKLVPLPKKLGELLPQELNFLIRGSRMGAEIKARLSVDILRLGGEYPAYRRIAGFLRAVEHQRAASESMKAVREDFKGSVVYRLGTTLQSALSTDKIAAPAEPYGVKVFRGFTPPKRGARVGDIYKRGTLTARCTGHHLWTYTDGSMMRWDSKQRNWMKGRDGSWA